MEGLIFNLRKLQKKMRNPQEVSHFYSLVYLAVVVSAKQEEEEVFSIRFIVANDDTIITPNTSFTNVIDKVVVVVIEVFIRSIAKANVKFCSTDAQVVKVEVVAINHHRFPCQC